MAKIQCEDTGNVRVIKAAGVLNIQDASTLKDFLLDSCSTVGDLLLDLSEVESMDVACLQVICSAHKTFQRYQKAIGTTGGISRGMTESLASMGLTPGFCDMGSHGACLWATGGTHE